MPQTLLDAFLANARSAAASAEVIPASVDALTDALLRATRDGEGGVLLGPLHLLDPALVAPFAARPEVITAPDNTQLRTTRTGVTEAFCGVASTGSICVAVDSGFTAVIGMLTRAHVAILPVHAIVPRPRDLFSQQVLQGEGLRRSFSFITGPSATADMGPLVRGVHGPGSLHIIVVA